MKLYRPILSIHALSHWFCPLKSTFMCMFTLSSCSLSPEYPCSFSVALGSMLCRVPLELLLGRYLFNGSCSSYTVIMYTMYTNDDDDSDDNYTPKRALIYLKSLCERILYAENSQYYGQLLCLNLSVLYTHTPTLTYTNIPKKGFIFIFFVTYKPIGMRKTLLNPIWKGIR